MNRIRLFKRNAQGKILSWEIENTGEHSIALRYGLLGHDQHLECYGGFTRDTEKEIKSRVDAKRKDGYKAIGELRDNAPTFISDSENMIRYLETYLPKDNTTLAGDKFCMLAKTLEDNKPFEKNTYNGQWKINGERCLIGAVSTNDMFKPITLTYQSRRGTDWTPNLFWMDDIILPCISKELMDMMIEENVKLDGELYLPGYNINDINHFIKNPSAPQHRCLQYWCYDIAVENMSAEARYSMLSGLFDNHVVNFTSKTEHLNNEYQFLVLPTVYISNFNQAMEERNKYIDLGFEGLIIRDTNAEYQFGKRNLSMLKYKKIYDGYFEIIDIQPQSKKENLPLFILRNDINNETFECTINLPHDIQEQYLLQKSLYIKCKGFVEYRERSGVKEVPFHAKLIKIIDEFPQTISFDKIPERISEEKPKVIKPKKIKLKL